MAAQDSLSSSPTLTPDTEPFKNTQQALPSTHAVGQTDVPFMHSTQRQADSQTVKSTASTESVDKATLFEGIQSLQENGGLVGSAHTDISHTKTTLASNAVGPLSTEVRGGLASSLPPATEPLTLGTSSLRKEVIGPTESPQASRSPVHSTSQVSTEVEPTTTEGPIQSPAEDASPPAGSGDQVIPVSKKMAEGSPITVTISPLPPRRATRTSRVPTKMAEAQPRPTDSIVLLSISTPASPKTSPPSADSNGAHDWKRSTAAATTAAVSTGRFQPGESDV